MLEHIWVQLSHLDVFSSMPLPLAIGLLPTLEFAARTGNSQRMGSILIRLCREAEELLHSFCHLTMVMEQSLCRLF